MKSQLNELNAEAAAQQDAPGRKPSLEGKTQTSPTLRMRVGVHTGPVVVGLLDERKNKDFVVVGDTVNLASRLQSNAPVDGILISHDTYRHVRGVFDVQAVDPLQLKGKTEPVTAYLVLKAKPRAFRVNLTGVEGNLTRLIGRDDELQRLKEAYNQVRKHHDRRVVTLVGEAGMGKSRLIYELDDWIETQSGDYYYFLGRANQAMQKVSFSLVRDVLTFRFQIQDSDLPFQVRDKLEHGIQEAIGADESAAMKAAFIGRVLGFELGENPHTSGIDARQILDRGLAYLEEYFRGMTSQGLVVALLEDIHWADDSTLELLSHLDNSLSDRPMLMICTARPSFYERQPQWEEGPASHIRIDLQPLTRVESSSLVDEILYKVQQLPVELRELVVNSAEGNPFYIE
jgi:ABC-type dipeptide/oligopeptide/nickel transport system ATPase subunit